MRRKFNPKNQEASFTFPMRIYFEDTDAGGVVYYANYLKFLERCRTEWLRSLGVDQSTLLLKNALAFMVRQVDVEYLKPAVLDDVIEVDMSIEKMTRVQIFFAQRIRRKTENGWDELVRGTIQVVCVNANEMKIASIPEFLRKKLELPQ